MNSGAYTVAAPHRGERMSPQTIENACEKSSRSTSHSNLVPHAELLPIASVDLSRSIHEDLREMEERVDKLRDSDHPHNRRRMEQVRPSTKTILSSKALRTDRGSLLQGPSLLGSGTAWAVLDLAVAFCCGSLANLIYVGNLHHLMVLSS